MCRSIKPPVKVETFWILDFADARTPLFPDGLRLKSRGGSRPMAFSQRRAFWRFPPGRARQDKTAAFLCLGFPPNKKTTRQRTKRDFGFCDSLFPIPDYFSSVQAKNRSV
jgi:hypothetical protein